MIEIKFLVLAICCGLFAWGGYSWHTARRFFMPTILSASTIWFIHSWWALTMLACCGTFCLGYGDHSPLRRMFSDGWGRGVWGLISALALSLGLFLTGHIFWPFFIGYLIINFILENALKNLPQLIGDFIIGCGFSSIFFILH